MGVVRDTPDLSFDVETFDMTAKLEALICGVNPSTGLLTSGGVTANPFTNGQVIDFNAQQPLTILAPFRSGQVNATIVNGVVIPNLALSQMQYRFANRQNASMTATFRGDSIFYTPHPPLESVQVWNGSATGPFTYAGGVDADEYENPIYGTSAYQYTLNVNFYNPDGSYGRLFFGPDFDYSDSDVGWSFNAGVVVAGGTATFPSGAVMQTNAVMRFQCSNSTGSESILQAANDNDGILIKPAAVRPYEIRVYFAAANATTAWAQVPGVQSFDATWVATGMEQNWEFGNPLAASIDYVVPGLTGTLTVRPNSVTHLANILAQTADLSVPLTQVIGALTSQPIAMALTINSPGPAPGLGTTLKTLYCPDAHFDPPDISIRVNQKLDVPFAFQSDTGKWFTYNGLMSGLTA